jgi:hypothetical protein
MRPIAVPLLATCPSHTRLSCMATSPPPLAPSWLHCCPPPAAQPCCRPPCSHTCRVTARPAAWPWRCLPHSCTRCHPSATDTGHIAAHLAVGCTTLLPPSQPRTLRCPPHSRTVSPHASQLRGPHRCLPLSHAGHVAPSLAAGQATSLHAS